MREDIINSLPSQFRTIEIMTLENKLVTIAVSHIVAVTKCDSTVEILTVPGVIYQTKVIYASLISLLQMKGWY